MTVRPDPVRPVTKIHWGVHACPEDGHNLEAAERAVQEIVDKVATEIGELVPQITVKVVTGDPAEELIKAGRWHQTAAA
jgi:hypothetical protein